MDSEYIINDEKEIEKLDKIKSKNKFNNIKIDFLFKKYLILCNLFSNINFIKKI